MKIKLLFLYALLPAISMAQNKKVAGKIMDTIFKIKEVKQRSAYVEKHSGGTRQLSVIFYTKPTRKNPYYWVKVWESNGDNYVTHFHFFIYPKPFTIKYYDTARDTTISLDEWRRENRISN